MLGDVKMVIDSSEALIETVEHDFLAPYTAMVVLYFVRF
jgi:hypothetical protein